MPVNTMTQQPPQQSSNKPRPTCHHCKKPSHYQNQCRQLKREKDQTRSNTNRANNNNGSAQSNSNPNNNKVTKNTKRNNIKNQRDRKPRPVFPPCETCGRSNHSTEKCYLGPNAAKDRLHEIDDRKDRTKVNRIMLKATQTAISKLQPKL